MNLIPQRSFFKKKSTLLYVFILSLLFLVASCSIKGPGSRTGSYPDHTGKPGNPNDYDFDYRRDKLLTLEKEGGKSLEQEWESLSGPETLDDFAGFADDLGRASLEQTITNQLQAMFEQETSTPVRLGSFILPHGRLVETLETFLDILKRDLPFEEFNKKILEEFVLYRVGKGKNKKMLFTAYYRPIMQASQVRTPLYRYPIYQMPKQGLPQVKYENGIQLVGTHAGIKKVRESYLKKKAWQRFTREEIDHKGVLRGRGLEVAWLKDDLDRFFLHIQGSGILEFPDGSRRGVGYQGSNQYSYTSIGKLMIQDGVIDISQGSMQGIKKYFADHPQDTAKYLYQNKRYIFFTLNDNRPRGSGGGELVGGRSIATDKSIYPAGGLAFIKVRQPILDKNNKIVRWQLTSRFVVDQDTGNAIRGPGRGDLFFGTGQEAGAKAGHYYERGIIYYLIKKN